MGPIHSLSALSIRFRKGLKQPGVARIGHPGRAVPFMWTARPLAGSPLLDLGFSAGVGELLGNRLGIGLGHAFFHRLGCTVDKVLGFL